MSGGGFCCFAAGYQTSLTAQAVGWRIVLDAKASWRLLAADERLIC